MKKKGILLIFFCVILLTSLCYAQTPVRKLGRGVANVVTCPIEIFYRMNQIAKQKGPIAGVSWGLFLGVTRMVVRGSVGVYEILTFPIPYPKGYRPLMSDPEFFLEQDTFF